MPHDRSASSMSYGAFAAVGAITHCWILDRNSWALVAHFASRSSEPQAATARVTTVTIHHASHVKHACPHLRHYRRPHLLTHHVGHHLCHRRHHPCRHCRHHHRLRIARLQVHRSTRTLRKRGRNSSHPKLHQTPRKQHHPCRLRTPIHRAARGPLTRPHDRVVRL